MGRSPSIRSLASLLVLACATRGTWANKKAFSIHDDLLAYPQFQVLFPSDFVLESYAEELLQPKDTSSAFAGDEDKRQRNPQVYLNEKTKSPRSEIGNEHGEHTATFEEMMLQGRRYLCQIPRVDNENNNTTAQTQETDEAEKQKELARATDRGLELLREMEGKCMYYVSGWWSYSFCYNNQIKQFHALSSGNGIPSYPPMEDPSTHSFVLGKFPQTGDDDDGDREKKTTTELAELQTKGGSRYLVQRLEGGSKCDLTGRNRKIEVQFHCHPQSTDRVGWIKELTTCSYLMVIYTPRLCNDVAFLPPQQDEVHPIECREILSPDEVSEWEAMQEYRLAQKLVESAAPEFPIVGGIEVGAQKQVGTEGRQIEKGRVASIGDEKVEIVAKRENGEVKRLSKEELKRLDLDPEKIEELKKRLEDFANGKDWELGVVESNGERGLRWIVDSDEDEQEQYDVWQYDGSAEEEEEDREGTAAERESGREKNQQRRRQQHDTQEENRETIEEKEPERGSEEVFKDEL